MRSYLCLSLSQLSTISSSQLCVRLASGGDPTYAFNVRLTGEEVHGTSMYYDYSEPVLRTMQILPSTMSMVIW